jgi:asparagine synthetase B (glutamine-hydrolysing)
MCGILTLFKTLKTINSTTKKEILESGKPLNNRGPVMEKFIII